jgi:hypothetical protein
MGYSITWLAVKGLPAEAVRNKLGFRPTGQMEEFPESELTGVEMPNGWYLIVDNRRAADAVAPDTVLQDLSASGCELVTCLVEEHVMVSVATGWSGGTKTWSILHDSTTGKRHHLEAKGEPPPAFAAIRDELTAKQETIGGCDYILDIPVETARSVTSFRHDEDVPGLTGEVFEVLAEVGPREKPPKKQSFLKRLFGG